MDFLPICYPLKVLDVWSVRDVWQIKNLLLKDVWGVTHSILANPDKSKKIYRFVYQTS